MSKKSMHRRTLFRHNLEIFDLNFPEFQANNPFKIDFMIIVFENDLYQHLNLCKILPVLYYLLCFVTK